MLLLEQDITRKERMNELFLEPELEFDTGNNKEYKVEAIIDSTIYAQEIEEHLLGLYYLVFWKSYSKKKNIWKPSSTVMHLWKMISIFHKNYPEKPMTTSSPLDFAPPMVKPSVKSAMPSTKQKRDRPTGSTKRAKE